MSTYWYRPAMLLALCLCAAIQPVVAGGIRQLTPKPKTMNGHFVAKVPLERVTSFGLNHESYVFEAEIGGRHPEKQVIKLSYRFDQRDSGLPSSLFDYSLTHSFRVTRNEDCDESWESLSSRQLFDSFGTYQGKRSALVYASNATVPDVSPPDTLACYVTTPQDYRSTTRSRIRQAKAPAKKQGQTAENTAPSQATAEKTSPAKSFAPTVATGQEKP